LTRISILLIALLAFVASACSGGEPSSSAAPSESASAEESAEPTESESTEPEASGSAVAIPSFDMNGDPELAGRFPDSVGGQALQVQSFRGDIFMAGGGADPSFQAFLDSVDAELEDVSVAFGGSMTGESVLSVGAFRVLGVAEDRLEEEFLSASQEAGDVSGITEQSVAGKDVWTASDPSGETAGSMFIYVKDDTVYFLTGTEEQAAEILAALP
jgi:hypothetical protein